MSVVHTAREYRSFCKAPPQSDAVTYRILHTYASLATFKENESEAISVRMNGKGKNPVGEDRSKK